MKIIAGVLAGTLFVSVHAHGQSITLEHVARTNEIIDLAYRAHGGERSLDELETVIVEQRQTSYSIDQSRAAEPPWDQAEEHGFNAVDLRNRRFANRIVFTGSGVENDTGTIINGNDSAQVNYRAGTVATIASPDFDAASAAFTRVTPALLVSSLKERAANAHYLGETEIDDVEYDVVAFSMPVGPAITLYFDKDEYLLRRSERMFPGAGMVEYEFVDYEIVDGFPFNRTFRLALEGDPNLEREILSVAVNQPIDERLVVARNLQRIDAQVTDELRRQEIDDGVWLIGGNGTYAMFVDMGDYVFAAGATAGIPDRIRLLREVVGNKPIRYAMLTHHHFDHVMGVQAYESEGATIIAATAHAEIARRAAANAASLALLEIDGEYLLTSGERRIRIIDVGPTAHTNHLLVAYLPEEGILFEGDHFAMPVNGPVPPAVPSTRSFAEALEQHGLQPQRFLSEHSPHAGTPADMEKALATRPFQTGR